MRVGSDAHGWKVDFVVPEGGYETASGCTTRW